MVVGVGYCVGLVFLSIKFDFVGFGMAICCWLQLRFVGCIALWCLFGWLSDCLVMLILIVLDIALDIRRVGFGCVCLFYVCDLCCWCLFGLWVLVFGCLTVRLDCGYFLGVGCFG